MSGHHYSGKLHSPVLICTVFSNLGCLIGLNETLVGLLSEMIYLSPMDTAFVFECVSKQAKF